MTKYILIDDKKDVQPIKAKRLHSAILEAQIVHSVRRVAFGLGSGYPCLVDFKEVANAAA